MRDTELYQQLLGLHDPWMVTNVELDAAASRVDIWVEDRSGATWSCPECGTKASVYDHSEERVWRHLNTCQFGTYIHGRLPRIRCPEHGVRQVPAPWAEPSSRFTLLYENWVVAILKECDVTGATHLTDTGWHEAWSVMERGVHRGLSRKEKRIPDYLGIDEKSFAKRHRYETLVCDLKKGTVEAVLDNRRQDSLEGYYSQFSKEELQGVTAVAMDRWDPYIAATKEFVPDAQEKIVFDRFHVIRQVTEAVDQVRRHEHKLLMAQGEEFLKGTKHLWLMNKEHIPQVAKGRI